jgi:hypothetical protein
MEMKMMMMRRRRIYTNSFGGTKSNRNYIWGHGNKKIMN